jgi:hypothetical protein
MTNLPMPPRRSPMFTWLRDDDSHVLTPTARFQDMDWPRAPLGTVLRTTIEKWRMTTEKCKESDRSNRTYFIHNGGGGTCAMCEHSLGCLGCILDSAKDCCGRAYNAWVRNPSARTARAVLAYVTAVRNTAVDAARTIPLQTFLDAARANLSNTGNGLVNVHVDDDAQCAIIQVDRTAYTAFGYECGKEEYYGTLAAITHDDTQVVVPSAMQIHWEPAQPPITHDEIDAEARLRDNEIPFAAEDDLVELANEHGLYEGDYSPPDDDFAWQELDHHLNEIVQSAIKEQK